MTTPSHHTPLHAVLSGDQAAPLQEPLKVMTPDDIAEALSKGTSNVALKYIPATVPFNPGSHTLESLEEGKVYAPEQTSVVFAKGFNILLPYDGCSFPEGECLIETIGREVFRLFIEDGRIKVQCVSLGPVPKA